MSKFAPELDAELISEMDKYIKVNLTSKKVTEINAKEDFKINDIAFKNPKLKKLTEAVKRRRLELYLKFNQIFIELMPFITLDDK